MKDIFFQQLEVLSVFTEDGLTLLDKPKKVSEMECHRCHGKEGIYLSQGQIWSCSQETCKKKNLELVEGKSIKDFPEIFGGIYRPHNYEYEPKIIFDMKSMKVPSIYLEASFERSDQPFDRVEELKKWSIQPKGFYLFVGYSGRGKTYTACSCLNEYRLAYNTEYERNARFCSVSELYLIWKQKAKECQEIDLLESMNSCELIVLDDLGIRTPSDSFLEFLYILVNKRENEDLGTIVTTNFNSKQMMEKLGDALTSRICSGKILKFDGNDKRFKPDF